MSGGACRVFAGYGGACRVRFAGYGDGHADGIIGETAGRPIVGFVMPHITVGDGHLIAHGAVGVHAGG